MNLFYGLSLRNPFSKVIGVMHLLDFASYVSGRGFHKVPFAMTIYL